MEYKKMTRLFIIALVSLFGISAGAQNLNHIEIKNFSLVVDKDKIMINWSTPADASPNYFEIEKSHNGRDYTTMAYVLGPDPNKPGSQFGYFDKIEKRKARIFYRIKHVGQDGVMQYSDPQELSL